MKHIVVTLISGVVLAAAVHGPVPTTIVKHGAGVAAIVLSSDAGVIAKRAAQLLQSRIRQKTAANLNIVVGPREAAQVPSSFTRIVIASVNSDDLAKWMNEAGLTKPRPNQLGTEGFLLKVAGRTVFVVAKEGRGLIYGVGKLLHTAEYTTDSMIAAPSDVIERPVMADRVLYLATHADNYYEVQKARNILPIIEESALWGTNGLSVWLDETQYNDPFDSTVENAGVRRKWKKLIEILRLAQDLGLKPGYVMSANDLYKNQVNPAIVAKGTSWNKAPLADPTTKEGRAIILRDKTNIFRSLAEGGIQLDNVLLFPYDTGGCSSERCKPWILTFLNLSRDIAKIIHRYHPAARVYIADWHTDNGEAKLITDFFNQQKPMWLAGIWKDDRHPMDRFAAVDHHYQILAFLDITMIGGWGTIGANPFPERLQTWIREMRQNHITGYMAYSEGIYDDFNKALIAQLAWNPNRPIAQVAREYCNYFFGQKSAAPRFDRILRLIEKSWSHQFAPQWDQKLVQSKQAADKLVDLTTAMGRELRPSIRKSWRWQVFAQRARLGQLAADLRNPSAFATEIDRRASRHLSKEATWKLITEKQAEIDEFNRRVADLRENQYHEPLTRYPLMIPRENFMMRHTRVPMREWTDTLRDLRSRFEAPPRSSANSTRK